jgi:hypothetical protein
VTRLGGCLRGQMLAGAEAQLEPYGLDPSGK